MPPTAPRPATTPAPTVPIPGPTGVVFACLGRLLLLLLRFLHGHLKPLPRDLLPHAVGVLGAEEPVDQGRPERCHGHLGALCALPLSRVAAAVQRRRQPGRHGRDGARPHNRILPPLGRRGLPRLVPRRRRRGGLASPCAASLGHPCVAARRVSVAHSVVRAWPSRPLAPRLSMCRLRAACLVCLPETRVMPAFTPASSIHLGSMHRPCLAARVRRLVMRRRESIIDTVRSGRVAGRMPILLIGIACSPEVLRRRSAMTPAPGRHG